MTDKPNYPKAGFIAQMESVSQACASREAMTTNAERTMITKELFHDARASRRRTGAHRHEMVIELLVLPLPPEPITFESKKAARRTSRWVKMGWADRRQYAKRA